MRLPVLCGTIKRRLLVNFRVDPEVVQRQLPPPFRPKLQRGNAIAGICLIRLENIRPLGLPSVIGFSSENAAHRIGVEWEAAGERREGVFIPRRDTSSWLNHVAGGRLFPGEHHPAKFAVQDDGRRVDFFMQSRDRAVSVRVVGAASDRMPAGSCFESVGDASTYFEGGSLGYSVTRDRMRLDGLTLKTLQWTIGALHLSEVESSYFSDRTSFPQGSLEFDHALVMRDVAHEWHPAEDLMLPI